MSKWKKGKYNSGHLSLAGGFITASWSWDEGGYKLTILGVRMKKKYDDSGDAQIAAEVFLRDKLSEAQKELE